jgi:hypothetical protein
VEPIKDDAIVEDEPTLDDNVLELVTAEEEPTNEDDARVEDEILELDCVELLEEEEVEFCGGVQYGIADSIAFSTSCRRMMKELFPEPWYWMQKCCIAVIESAASPLIVAVADAL